MRTFVAVVAATALISIITFVSSLSAQSPYNSRRAPTSVELLAASIAGTGPSGATGLVTLAADCSIAGFENTTGVEVDALIGSTKKRVPAGTARIYDLGAANTRLAAGTKITVFGNGTAPTGGAFEFFCMPY